ncbi:Bestrophin, RFP-TM, chloride channel-domain-containing protein [Gorgonomyces haynaldii]|nr:Bestrophin, RFP-TM, chloride channel-domain-containing protein [Gorgonomyces haynaldii]
MLKKKYAMLSEADDIRRDVKLNINDGEKSQKQKLYPAEKAIKTKLKPAKNRLQSISFVLASGNVSIWHVIQTPVFLLTGWGAFWTLLFELDIAPFLAINGMIVTILGVVLGLLLVFRTNTAYDRFWDARQRWSTLCAASINLSRLIWLVVQPRKTESQDIVAQKGAINLIYAFSIACKHYLREEYGYNYEDLYDYVQHIPEITKHTMNIPLAISCHISSYIRYCRDTEQVDPVVGGNMLAQLTIMIECLQHFERVRYTPIPAAYSIHLKQTVYIYLGSLPFQLFSTLHWATIPVMLICSFVMLGILGIAGEIENPFGYDENDLDLRVFCSKLRKDLSLILMHEAKSPVVWGEAVAFQPKESPQ